MTRINPKTALLAATAALEHGPHARHGTDELRLRS